jgi:hypothetical protein
LARDFSPQAKQHAQFLGFNTPLTRSNHCQILINGMRELFTQNVSNSIWRISMISETKPVSLTVNISAGMEIDADALDHLTRQLLAEIQELEVKSVELARNEARPAGAKAVDPITLGALAVAVLPAVVPKLVELLQSWAMRGENRMVKIKTQIGDQSLEVEYSPRSMSQAELMGLVNTLTGKLMEKNARK